MSNDVVIRVENLSKQYRYGVISHGMLYRDIQSWWARKLGKEDPNSIIGKEQRAKSIANKEHGAESKAQSVSGAGNALRYAPGTMQSVGGADRFWALQDVSFDVKEGEILGIIGRNGAGKSTLLKILSRVTAPTKGIVKIKGRVASLLEVGTGFHPELTGRENIYLNGAILGMTKIEISRKFDEIVAFAEIEKFVDTPVKRYSSGMYVRLAFAVAAHLEPEILIVDEVLAVGDAQFQKKCLGKMGEVAKGGRTVLFVSHNMPMITSLCSRAILLDEGKIIRTGKTSEVVLHYYSDGISSASHVDFTKGNKHIGNEDAVLISGSVKNSRDQITAEIDINEEVKICMRFKVLGGEKRLFIPNFHFFTADGTYAFDVICQDAKLLSSGEYSAECKVPANFLNDGTYFIGIALHFFGAEIKQCFFEKNAVSFNVKDPIEVTPGRYNLYSGPIPGVIRPQLQWEITNV